jgi:hypothetical protein
MLNSSGDAVEAPVAACRLPKARAKEIGETDCFYCGCWGEIAARPLSDVTRLIGG